MKPLALTEPWTPPTHQVECLHLSFAELSSCWSEAPFLTASPALLALSQQHSPHPPPPPAMAQSPALPVGQSTHFTVSFTVSL